MEEAKELDNKDTVGSDIYWIGNDGFYVMGQDGEITNLSTLKHALPVITLNEVAAGNEDQ